MPNEQLETLAISVLDNNPDLQQLCTVVKMDAKDIPAYQQLIEDNNVKVLISRGGTAVELEKRYKNRIPTVEIKINIPLVVLKYFDLKKDYPETILFCTESFRPDQQQLDELKEAGYEMKIFEEVRHERGAATQGKVPNYEELLQEAKNTYGDQLYVLGDSSACPLAEKIGVKNELIDSTETDIVNAIHKAQEILQKIFVGIPEKIMKNYRNVFEHTILKETNRKPTITFEEIANGSIWERIKSDIDDCSLAIFDLTYDRPNCYLELGYAIGIGKDYAIFHKKDETPFGLETRGRKVSRNKKEERHEAWQMERHLRKTVSSAPSNTMM